MGRRGYPAEFRRKVLDPLADGNRVARVAHDLDISDQTIYSWRRQDRIDRGLQPGHHRVPPDPGLAPRDEIGGKCQSQKDGIGHQDPPPRASRERRGLGNRPHTRPPPKENDQRRTPDPDGGGRCSRDGRDHQSDEDQHAPEGHSHQEQERQGTQQSGQATFQQAQEASGSPAAAHAQAPEAERD